LWAGPLCARILAEAGARVVKVEDRCRPDGARRSPSFYRWIHPVAERGVRIDFNSADGRRALGTLLDSADVVIEASRARALEQIGFSPEQRDGPDGQIWLSITAHGRSGDARNWIGFGDDTAVAGGFMCRDADGGAAFCGDAIADPITGLVGALAVLRARHEGGGQLIDLSLSGAASWAGAGELDGPAPVVEPADGGWQVSLGGRSIRVADRPASAVLVAGP
jgi:crotonobetainyl-CoA:carnitine CoA-transferase CaiB-like acyl-CoA transferase